MLFGKGKLLREGAQADAVVIALGGGSQRGALFKIQLRVTFEDGSQTEIWRRKGNDRALPWVVEGARVPVRYDRADRSRIEIDFPTWKARCVAESDRRRQEAIRSAEETSDRGDEPSGNPIP